MTLVTLTLAGGCASTEGSDGIRDPAEARPAGVSTTAAERDRSRELAVLRRAMRPPEEPQPVHLDLRETRETSGEGFSSTRHELHLEISGTLVGESARDRETTRARLVLEHIRLEYSAPGRRDEMLSYDSSRDSAGGGNALADLMNIVAGAEVALTVDASGRLIECDGLDPLWRKADLLMAPPALLTAQWLFRDIGMCELLSEALFPPMPSDSVRVGETFEVDMPANIMLAAPLVSHLRGSLLRTGRDSRNHTTAEVHLQGTVGPAASGMEEHRPGIAPAVRSSRHEVSQRISPDTGSLAQTSERRVEVVLTLQPPAGNQRREITIRQERLLVSQRGRPD